MFQNKLSTCPQSILCTARGQLITPQHDDSFWYSNWDCRIQLWQNLSKSQFLQQRVANHKCKVVAVKTAPRKRRAVFQFSILKKFLSVRVAGVEPAFAAWKAAIMAVIRHPHIKILSRNCNFKSNHNEM